MLPQVKSPFARIMFQALFATGCRQGELFAVARGHFRFPVLNVTQQLDRKLKTRGTKNKKKRICVVLAEGRASLDKWIALADDDKRKLRRRRFHDSLKAACRRAFPDDPRKHLVVHDLRHSYAIHLLERGANIDAVARAIGDSVAVALEHYAGFAHTDAAIQHLHSLVNRPAGNSGP